MNTTTQPTEFDMFQAMMLCEKRAAVEASRGKHDLARAFRMKAADLQWEAWNRFEAVREMERWHG